MDINKWAEELNSSDSELSVSSTNGNKLKLKNDSSISLNKVLKGLWLSLTILTVTTSALTINEWSSRMDTIKQGIINGTIDTHTEAVDSQFYVNRGANFKDSFLAVIAKVTNQFESEKQLSKAEREDLVIKVLSGNRAEPKSVEITESELLELEKKYPIQELNDTLKKEHKNQSEDNFFKGSRIDSESRPGGINTLTNEEITQKIKQIETDVANQKVQQNRLDQAVDNFFKGNRVEPKPLSIEQVTQKIKQIEKEVGISAVENKNENKHKI